jgi:INO80 complex subunit E
MAAEKSSKDTSVFKPQYRTLKRRFKFLVYENECYQEELRKSQREFLQVSRDKTFLLERLLQYEKVESASGDSDATDSSDSEPDVSKAETTTKGKKRATAAETNNLESGTATKKRKTGGAAQNRGKNMNQTANKGKSLPVPAPVIALPSAQELAPIKTELKQDNVRSATSKDGQLTSEELERHFEARPLQASMLIPEKTPLTVPVELFSNESSTGLPDEDSISQFIL